ncbi:MAG: acyltransferase [Planctomycetota bacterium]|jgi:acetyltransferase-like isoleucine patch superfamily enzyme
MNLDDSVFVHETALCESDQIGAGTRIWAFAHVMQGAQIGADCNICDHAFIETGAVLGNRVIVKNNVMVWDKVVVEDDVFLGPNAVLTNDFIPRAAFKNPPEKFLPTIIKAGASIGANATIVCGVTIGVGAFVGAGTVVIRDVPAFVMVVGNPAREIGWICACGERLGDSLQCTNCSRSYEKAGEGLQLLNA